MDFDLILDPLNSADEDTSIDLTGIINNINAPGSEVTLDIDWGDSTVETLGIIDGGNDDADGAVDGSISFSVPHIYDEDGNFDISVNAQEQVVAGTDAVFVIDVSGSASSSSGIDVDGDGSNDTILDAEVAAFKALNQNLIDRGLGNSAKVSVVTYSSSERLLDLDPATAGDQTFTTPLADTDNNGVRDIDQALDTLFAGGGTDFEDGLQGAVLAVENAGTAAGNGTVIFLSDGFPNTTFGFDDEVNTIINSQGQNLRAFGVGPNSSLSALQQIDPNAVQFSDIQDLLNLFDGAGGGSVDNSDAETATITINDVPENPEPIIPNPVTNALNPVSGGTAGNDGLVGTDAADLLEGLGGSDALDGRAGDDEINGGGGIDTAVYQFDPAGVTVDLASGTATDGFGGTDTLISIENIIGSGFDDSITGDDGVNNLTGGDGSDTINAGGGNDFVVGGAGADNFSGGAGSDTFLYLNPSEGGDTINDFETGSDKIQIVGSLFTSGLSGGTLSSSEFFSGSAAVDADDRFGYDSATGEVLFDADGSGSGPTVTLATLANNPADFSNTDITVL